MTNFVSENTCSESECLAYPWQVGSIESQKHFPRGRISFTVRNCFAACGSTRLSRIVRNRRTVDAGGESKPSRGRQQRYHSQFYQSPHRLELLSLSLSLSFSFFLSLRPGHPLCLSPLEANSLSPHVPRTDIRESVDVCRPTSELIEFDSAVTCLTANRIANIFEPLVS